MPWCHAAGNIWDSLAKRRGERGDMVSSWHATFFASKSHEGKKGRERGKTGCLPFLSASQPELFWCFSDSERHLWVNESVLCKSKYCALSKDVSLLLSICIHIEISIRRVPNNLAFVIENLGWEVGWENIGIILRILGLLGEAQPFCKHKFLKTCHLDWEV